MNRNSDHANGQCGSAMVMTLFILSILTMVGLLAAKSSTTEIRMAANEMHRKQAFYAAEGVAELVSEIIEENIAYPNGFTENRPKLSVEKSSKKSNNEPLNYITPKYNF